MPDWESDEQRFWKNVSKRKHGCWIYRGPLTHDGYARCTVLGERVYAHRAAYEFAVGPIPQGLDIDHLCRRRNCVHPLHLEPVTRKENLERGHGRPGLYAGKRYDRKPRDGSVRIESGRVIVETVKPKQLN